MEARRARRRPGAVACARLDLLPVLLHSYGQREFVALAVVAGVEAALRLLGLQLAVRQPLRPHVPLEQRHEAAEKVAGGVLASLGGGHAKLLATIGVALQLAAAVWAGGPAVRMGSARGGVGAAGGRRERWAGQGRAVRPCLLLRADTQERRSREGALECLLRA